MLVKIGSLNKESELYLTPSPKKSGKYYSLKIEQIASIYLEVHLQENLEKRVILFICFHITNIITSTSVGERIVISTDLSGFNCLPFVSYNQVVQVLLIHFQ